MLCLVVILPPLPLPFSHGVRYVPPLEESMADPPVRSNASRGARTLTGEVMSFRAFRCMGGWRATA